MLTIRRIGVLFGVAVAMLAIFCRPLLAADAVVTQSFQASQDFDAGTVVARNSDDPAKVEAATPDSRGRVTGVITSRDDSFVSYSSTGENTVDVATSGSVSVNVTTINGDIKAGDQLTASPISGFAMKATSAGKVIGRALADFSRSTNGAQIRTVNDTSSKPVEVGAGQIAMTIEISDWAGPSGTQNVFVENLRSFGGQVAGKQVSASNAVIAAMILSVGVLVSGIVLFSSVSASMHSLGRNPLSHKIIRRSLTQVILIVVVLLSVSVAVAYLIIGRG
jgi:hypothetical protein